MRNPESFRPHGSEAQEAGREKSADHDDPETGVPLESAEKVEAIAGRKIIEFLDDQGNRLGEATVEYKDVSEGSGLAKGSKLMERLVIKAPHGGKVVEYDVLELANARGAKIIVIPGNLDNEYDRKTNTVTVRPPESPDDIGILLHELGHADQYGEEKYGKIADVSTGTASGSHLERFIENAQSIADAIPEMKESIPWEKVLPLQAQQRELQGLERQNGVRVAEYEALKAELKSRDPDEAGYGELKGRHDVLLAEIRKTNVEIAKKQQKFGQDLSESSEALRPLEKIPTKIIERDATKRAFQWMRKIRKTTGISFLSASLRGHHVSSGSVQELRSGLESYGADENPLKDLDEKPDAA